MAESGGAAERSVVDRSATAPVIAATQLSMRFGNTLALNEVDIEINHGITGLVGANGAGKSTFLKLVLGLLEPTVGAIKTLGRDPIAKGTSVRSRVGYFPERNVLPDTMPAHEFVRHMTQLRGIRRSQARNRASDALWSVGLGEERFRVLGTMSTGQRQRVKLAQALAADPTLVLLDEPTEGLDPVQRESMLKLIVEVRDRHGVDIVMSSHVLSEVEQVCTAIVALNNGAVALAGQTDQLLREQQALATGGVADDAVASATGRDPKTQPLPAEASSPPLAQISLELLEEPERELAVRHALEQAGCVVSPSGSRLVVIAPPELGAGESEQQRYDLLCDLCRDALAEAGARVRQMGTHSHSLEDVLLAAADRASSNGVSPDEVESSTSR